ncbi:DUF3761 domain-containing protein [Pseudonocardia alni]|uniref:DUF3761 domain-containing protein n=1 Tax=Pseudonocardia alni TaxID=33907 RepID=UPI00280BEAEE|nr:DUF3761 domain-containing protein [Pseudonocardia alni]
MNGPGRSRYDDSPTERLGVVPPARNRLATVGIVLVVLSAAFLLTTATIPMGALLALAATGCAAIAAWRGRGGRAPHRGRAVTALVAAPALVVAAVALAPAPTTTGTTEAAALVAAPTTTTPTPVPAPAGENPPVAPAAVPSPTTTRAPVSAPETHLRTAPAAPETASARPQALASAPTPRATTAKPAPAARPSACDTDTHYVNSAGNCVPRPARSGGDAPAGATAKCRDGTYSFSQSRSGTCSRHGGVATWL